MRMKMEISLGNPSKKIPKNDENFSKAALKFEIQKNVDENKGTSRLRKITDIKKADLR